MKFILSLIICSSVAGDCMPPFDWKETFDKRQNPNGKNYYWLTGKFINLDKGKDTDQWALSNGYISIVPTMYDMTSYPEIDEISKWNLK